METADRLAHIFGVILKNESLQDKQNPLLCATTSRTIIVQSNKFKFI